MPQEREQRIVAQNKKARHDYTILSTYEAGMALTGTEVKSLRMGRASLVDGYVFIKGGEAWLDAVHIPEYVDGSWTNHAPRRARKLLLHRKEIDKLYGKSKEAGHTIIPLKIYFSGSHAKVEIALAKGKREYDKRQTLREKQDKREADRAMARRARMGE